jgi:hypothetical protein
MTELLGSYTSKGVAQASLQDLAGIYRSPSIEYLGDLTPIISDRAERAGGESVDQAFQVVFFKKLSKYTPPGITSNSLVDFITRQFLYDNEALKDEFSAGITNLIDAPTYNVLVITVLVFDTDTKAMTHHIVGTALYMHDKHGTFIFILCTEDQGNPNVCNLSNKYFSDPNLKDGDEPFLSPTSSFRRNGLATFMLSLLQVLADIRYKNPFSTKPHRSPSQSNAMKQFLQRTKLQL